MGKAVGIPESIRLNEAWPALQIYPCLIRKCTLTESWRVLIRLRLQFHVSSPWIRWVQASVILFWLDDIWLCQNPGMLTQVLRSNNVLDVFAVTFIFWRWICIRELLRYALCFAEHACHLDWKDIISFECRPRHVARWPVLKHTRAGSRFQWPDMLTKYCWSFFFIIQRQYKGRISL